MDPFFQLLMYVVPSVIVFLTAYFVLKQFMDKEYKNKLAELRMNNQSIITPIRLQAIFHNKFMQAKLLGMQ